MPNYNALDLLVAALWLMRDFMVAGAVVFSVLGLFSREDQGRALVLWIMGFLGTIPGLVNPDYDIGWFQLTPAWAALALVGSGALIALAFWRRRTGHTPPRSRRRRARW